MGGYGSGYQGSKKTTVEACSALSAARLMSQGVLRSNIYYPTSVTWTNTFTGEKVASIGFDTKTSSDSGIARLHYNLTDAGIAMDYRVQLTTTPLPWGGRRWWFICPLTTNGRVCNRRVGKLYLPYGGRYFGCRHCYDLTYTSCQESHKSDKVLAAIGSELGYSPWEVKQLLSGKCGF